MFRECKDKAYTGRKSLKNIYLIKGFVFNNNKTHNMVMKQAKKIG